MTRQSTRKKRNLVQTKAGWLSIQVDRRSKQRWIRRDIGSERNKMMSKVDMKRDENRGPRCPRTMSRGTSLHLRNICLQNK